MIRYITETEDFQWFNYTVEGAIPLHEHYHVIPGNDFRKHILSEDCWCKPERIDEADLVGDNAWSHNALDGREQYEEGILQLS